MRVLGLDLGTTSVGFALADYNETQGIGRIVHMGVRIFPEGVTEDKEPRNKARRDKRLARRLLRRRRLRRRLMNEALSEAGLLPSYSAQVGSSWNKAMGSDPYELRCRGVAAALTPHEIGRAIYHLAKRRGWRGRDDADLPEKKTDETGVIKPEITALEQKMAGRTLGAFLHGEETKRRRHTGREMIEDELKRLWEKQKAFHPDLLTEKLRERVFDLVLRQRPTFWRLQTLGTCRFVPDAPLAAKGSWLAQQYVMYEHINKLRIASGNARPLDGNERAIIVALAQKQATLSFGAIRKALKKLWTEQGQALDQTFNLEQSEKYVRGNALEAKLVNIFGETWQSHPFQDKIRKEIHQRLWNEDYVQIGKKRVEIRRECEAKAARTELAKRLEKEWSVTAEQAKALADITMPSGWLRISTQAIEDMMPELERGVGVGELTMSPTYENWRKEHWPQREQRTGEFVDRLPSRPDQMPEVRNPTVNRVLNETRKVVNNLLRVYGLPDLIRVELARDMRRSKKERLEAEKRRNRNKAERKKAVTDLQENGFTAPSENDIEKWRLWKECQELCPYTGRKIGFDALFRRNEFDVEHIWPRSRSLDNSFANKTLCEAEFNRLRKGNRTPYEVFGHNAEEMDALRKRLATCQLPEFKIRRFLKEEIVEAGSDAFSERQLQDTRYAAKEVRDFLSRLYPDVGGAPRVQTCNGTVTAQLRSKWQLNTILNPGENFKIRVDHRHHAVDALAVALTTPAFVKRLSDFYAREKQGLRPALPKPWPTLLEDVREAVGGVVVSHRVKRKVSGALHKETAYGDTGFADPDNPKLRVFVTRKNLEGLTRGQIDAIRDPKVREIVASHVEERGGDPKKAFPPYPCLENKDGSKREIRKARITIAQQPSLVVPLKEGNNAYADVSTNHHMAIYREKDGKITYEVVSLYEASRRLAARKPVINQRSMTGGKLVMSLCSGDMLMFPEETGPAYRVVTSVWAGGQVVLEDHNSSTGKVWSRPSPRVVIAKGAKKVVVDPIGRVRMAND